MPLPKPEEGQSEEEWLDVCMSDPTMEQEFPDETQRFAVCQIQWEDPKMAPKNTPKKQVTKTLRYHSVAKISKVDATDNGYIEGYASTYDDPDLVMETFSAGAYAKTIKERVLTGRVQLMDEHFAYGGGSRNVVGTITDAKEDDTGLWVHADFSSTQDAQDIRKKAEEGHLKYLSVGFVPVKWEIDDESEILTYTEVKLQEVTITNLPCNESASIVDAKISGFTPDQIAAALQSLKDGAATQSIDDAPGHNTVADPHILEAAKNQTEMYKKKLKILF